MAGTRQPRALPIVLLVCGGLFANCAAPSGPLEPAPSQRNGGPSPNSSTSSAIADVARPTPQTEATAPTYLIRYNFRSDRPLYYIIENEFVDHGGVPGFLSYTTVVTDRRTITQTVLPPDQTGNTATGAKPMTLSWVCDRYEVTEKGMKDKVSFDSLRDLYPRAALRGLGTVAGSKVVFQIDPQTGRSQQPRITPGKFRGPSSRKKLSSTARRCALNPENLTKLLDDLGPLFIPDSAKAVGDTWTNRREETGKGDGRAIRDYTFTLSRIREESGRKIAVIDVQGDVRLQTADPGAGAPAGNPVRRRGASRPRRDFKIDRKLCTGSIEFDLTHGELVRLTLRRALDLSAKMESKQNRPMTIETGSAHVLRVEVRQTPPPKPMIVGGPKPPPEEPDSTSQRPALRGIGRGVQPVRPLRGAGRTNATSRPDDGTVNPTRQQTSSRPAVNRIRPRIFPRSPSPRRGPNPALLRQRMRRPRPPRRATSQPTSRPARNPS